MRKLLFLFVALLATTTVFGREYFSPISVTDGTAADWDALPAEYLASATHTEGCSLDGLKSVKVFADDASINLLVEWNPAGIDLSCVPFLVFINVDPGAATGGFGGDYWMDPNDIDLLTEGFIFLDGMPCAYEPGLFAYGGAYNTNEWNWTELVPGSSDWIKSQHLGDNKMEIQIIKDLIPVQWADEFTIGFDIQVSWNSVGVLPNAADDELGNRVLAEKLRVQVCHLDGSLHQNGLHYEITSNVKPYTMAVVDADTDITMATIPETIEYYGTTFAVTSIGYSAFSYCSSLVAVSIPNSVTSIEDGAFSNCSSLTLMMVENGNTVYDSRQNCNAIIETATNTLIAGCQNTTIPNGITSIGRKAFYGCTSLSSITIPNSVTEIGNHAFDDCSSLTSITIPNSVTSIGYSAFSDCSSLTSITIPNSVTSIGSWAFSYCSSLTSITIPNSVTSIGENVFASCSALEYLSIPNSVQYASEGDYNNEVYYSEGFSSILGCYNLKTLIVPADFFAPEDEYDYPYAVEEYLPYLPEKLESLTINGGNMDHRFGWDFINRNRKSLKHIDFGATESIAEEAFTNYYNLESLVLPSQLETVPYMAVAECVKLQSISIPATVTAIEDRAFENCRMLSSVAFAENGALTRIGNWAFYNNHELTNLVIPEGVTEVGHAAFYGCTYLKEMTLPSTVQNIADNGFALCAKLQRMNVDALIPPTVAARTFEEVDRTIPVYVPDEVVSAYQTAPVWQEFNVQGKSNAPAAVDNIQSPTTSNRKLLRDGQLLILRDGKTYTIMGAEIH